MYISPLSILFVYYRVAQRPADPEFISTSAASSAPRPDCSQSQKLRRPADPEAYCLRTGVWRGRGKARQNSSRTKHGRRPGRAHNIISHHIISLHFKSHHFTLYRTMSFHTTPYHIISDQITSYSFNSHHIISHHITSHQFVLYH